MKTIKCVLCGKKTTRKLLMYLCDDCAKNKTIYDIDNLETSGFVIEEK